MIYIFITEYFYIYIIVYIFFLKNQNYTNSILYFYIHTCSILYNNKTNQNTLSYYYQLVCFLNTKNNIFIVLIILLLLFKNKIKKHQKLMYFIHFCVYTFLLSMGFNINKLCYSFLENTTNSNLSLLNGVMLIHPIILYIFYSLFLYKFGIILQKLINFSKKNINTTIKQNTLKLGLIILLANTLGGWWAEQELSWGGWWSWDFVELLAANYLIFLLYNIHNKNIITTRNYYNQSILIFCIIFTSIISVRFNLINSIHNFINNDPQNQYFYYIFIILVLCLLHTCIILKKEKYLPVLPYIKFTVTISITFIILLILFIYIYIYFTFLASLLNFNSNTSIKDLYLYVVLCAIIILILNNQSKLEYYILYFIFNININVNLLCLIFIIFENFSKNKFKQKKIYVKLLHNILLIYVYFSLQQIYNFYPCISIPLNYNLIYFKVNNLSNIYNINCTNSIYFVDSLKQNTFDYIFGNFKAIFEKTLLFNKNNLSENYSYNLQVLVQINGINLIVSAFFVMYLTFKLVYLQQKKIKI